MSASSLPNFKERKKRPKQTLNLTTDICRSPKNNFTPLEKVSLAPTQGMTHTQGEGGKKARIGGASKKNSPFLSIHLPPGLFSPSPFPFPLSSLGRRRRTSGTRQKRRQGRRRCTSLGAGTAATCSCSSLSSAPLCHGPRQAGCHLPRFVLFLPLPLAFLSCACPCVWCAVRVAGARQQDRQRRWLGTVPLHEVPGHVGGLPNQRFPSFSAALQHSWCCCPNQTCAPDKKEHKSPPLPPTKSPSWTKHNVLEEEGRRRGRSLGGGDA
jgi:hypothetical protein